MLPRYDSNDVARRYPCLARRHEVAEFVLTRRRRHREVNGARCAGGCELWQQQRCIRVANAIKSDEILRRVPGRRTPVDRHDCARCNGTWSTPGRNRGGCRIDGVGHPACEHERRIAVLCCLAIRNLPRTGQALTRVDRVAIKIGTVILPEMNARGLSASSGGVWV